MSAQAMPRNSIGRHRVTSEWPRWRIIHYQGSPLPWWAVAPRVEYSDRDRGFRTHPEAVAYVDAEVAAAKACP